MIFPSIVEAQICEKIYIEQRVRMSHLTITRIAVSEYLKTPEGVVKISNYALGKLNFSNHVVVSATWS